MNKIEYRSCGLFLGQVIISCVVYTRYVVGLCRRLSRSVGVGSWALGSGPASVARRKKAPGAPPGRAAGSIFFGDIRSMQLKYGRKPGNKVRLNASRTSKRCVSCFGMSCRRNELITFTLLLKSGVARTVCYVNCFLTANTEKGAYQQKLRRIPKNAFKIIFGHGK